MPGAWMRTGCKPHPDVGATSSPCCPGTAAGRHPHQAPRWAPAPSPAGASSHRGTVGTALCFAGTCCCPAKRDPNLLWVQEVPCNPPFLPRARGYPAHGMTRHSLRASSRETHRLEGPSRAGTARPTALDRLHPFQGTRRVTEGSALSPGRQPWASSLGRVGREPVTPQMG